ncbi:hypothetical protein [Clostridium brassicae]|uniref:Nucleotidyl transferase AbiEii/AbiGii toxin family protein n=1 Tax=Clostridium brassicae TaxID=2999072 RepID=A0ABT4D9Y2_9CLOT|nr:hypothetical protein [Clostridium brassicae]MCY6959090.1 hypothetical protein [Clostridium brassicae]
MIEKQIWIYELHSHIQNRLKDNVMLKGGACAQLYLDLKVQRCTEDLDLYTNLTKQRLRKEMKIIENQFNSNKVPMRLYEYVPKSDILSQSRLPITTFIVKLPFIFAKSRKIREESIKIDFLHISMKKIPKYTMEKSKTMAMDLNYNAISIDIYTLITSKIVTFAVNSIGIESFKKDKLYKNAYDMFYLIKKYNHKELFPTISQYLKKSINEEFKIKKIDHISIERIFEDILQELCYLSIYDLKENFTGYSKRFLDFQINYLQQGIKDKLDFDGWGIICSYLYLWVLDLKNYFLFKDISKCLYIDKIEEVYNLYYCLDEIGKENYIDNIKKELDVKKGRYEYDYIENPIRFINLYNIFHC